MRTPTHFFLLALAALLFSCGSDKTDDTFFPDAPVNPDQTKLLQLINDARIAGHNCGGSNQAATGTVVWSDVLANAAKKHSADMAQHDKLDHFGSNGSTPQTRLEAEGYEYEDFAENLAKGGATEDDVINLWLNSSDHCKNLMKTGVTEIGVGTKGAYWTLILAKPK